MIVKELSHRNRVNHNLESMFASPVMENKRKRGSTAEQQSRHRSRFDIDEVDDDDFILPLHKRSYSAFRNSAAEADSERRDEPTNERHDDSIANCVSPASNPFRTPLFRTETLPSSPQSPRFSFGHEPMSPPRKFYDDDEDLNASPTSSFCHPAILRATTIYESDEGEDTNDIYFDPPECISRPSSPSQEVEESGKYSPELTEVETQDTKEQSDSEEERDRPEWQSAKPSSFQWTFPAPKPTSTLFSSSPWNSNMFHHGRA